MAPNQGLVHPKEYDIKDSNVEFIGSDIDHRVKYNSAATEPAWTDAKAGSAPGLFVWRMEAFEVVPWPKQRYGEFYDGDSYIVLHSFLVGSRNKSEEERKLMHDVFFWLGAHTTQDEAGTAAYKTVELDEFLHGAATQHREVQSAPSEDFLALFPRLSIRSGGVRSGFRHVEEDPSAGDVAPTLLRVFKNPGAGVGVIVHEVQPHWRSLDDGDVFVLDVGDKIWVWQGAQCSPMEKARAAQVVHDMTLAKHIDVEVLSQAESRSRRVVDLLDGASDGDDEAPRDGFRKDRPVVAGNTREGAGSSGGKKLFRLSDASGELSFDMVKDGSAGRIDMADLDGNDVFLLDDARRAIWVWEGSRASRAEKARWMHVAQAYLQHIQGGEGAETAYLAPIAKVAEGSESKAFLKAIEA